LESQNDLTKRLSAIFETAVDGIIVINERGVIEDLNAAAARLFDYEKQELVGKTVNMLMPREHSERHDTYIHNYTTTRVPKIIGIGREIQGLKKTGQQFPFWLSVSEVILEERTIFTGFIHDLSRIKEVEEDLKSLNDELENKVTQRTYELEKVVNQLLDLNKQLEDEIKVRIFTEEQLKQREEELEVSLEKEKELGELKSRFVSMASHEFRTPLSTILSSASLIAKYPDTDQQHHREKHIQKIKSSVAHLTNILNDFLSISRLEEGKQSVRMEKFDIRDFVLEISDEIGTILKNEQQFKLTMAELSIVVESDPVMLKNILFNLISNAIKYGKHDTIIELSVYVVDSFIQFEVNDDGIGIPDEDQKHLFDRFFRAANATNIEGTGLGLHIVKKYTELLNGTLDFNSKLGEGTSFSIKLPLYLN